MVFQQGSPGRVEEQHFSASGCDESSRLQPLGVSIDVLFDCGRQQRSFPLYALTESTSLAREGRYKDMYARLRKYGYIFIREYLPLPAVNAAFAHVRNDLVRRGMVVSIAQSDESQKSPRVTCGKICNIDSHSRVGDNKHQDQSLNDTFCMRTGGCAGCTLTGSSLSESPQIKYLLETCLRPFFERLLCTSTVSNTDSAAAAAAKTNTEERTDVYTFPTKWMRVMGKDENSTVHSDEYFFGNGLYPGMVTCWTPIGDVGLDNAPLAVCSGTNKLVNGEGLFIQNHISASYHHTTTTTIATTNSFGFISFKQKAVPPQHHRMSFPKALPISSPQVSNYYRCY